MPKKSIYRQPGAQHFQLVHRSQRDPLIHDPDASQHVLKPFVRENDKKGKSRAELEQVLSPSDLAHDAARPNVGEATLYGIYYDDTEYDYMQHLRPVGMQEEGVESVLVEAPTVKKSRAKDRDPITLRDLPSESLPSTSELPRNYENQEAIPSSIAGFQPDMDPHLRQVLEALEDDAFVDDSLDEDFFGELVEDGERGTAEEFEFEFAEEGLPDVEQAETEEVEVGAEEDESWEARFAAFKKAQKAGRVEGGGSDVEGYSEGGDTVGRMPEFSVVGGKKRRKGTSDASGYSMSSSSMFRNEGLRLVDDRFDQIEKEYASSDEDDLEDDDSDSAPQLITTREDFDSMMNDFLDNYEIFGGKMKPALHGTGAEKLESLRVAMGQDERVREKDDDETSESDDADIYAYLEKEEKRDRWDVETVLTTHTNIENHPRLIRARDSKAVPRIRLDPKTGLPIVVERGTSRTSKIPTPPPESDESDATPARVTIARPRDETKEEKKARKQAVKAERQARRIEKKTTKEQFTAAIKQQSQVVAGKDIKTRKL